MTELEKRLISSPVVPLVQTNAPGTACDITRALAVGGLTVAEVVLRTPAALNCLESIAKTVPETIVGAGTVLTMEQCRDAINAGAKFIVSPGLDDNVVRTALDDGIPVFPGTATATEVQHALNLGLKTVKFFPAGLAGGTSMLKALASVYREMHFMPTGGISASNLEDYLRLSSVIACGGSWLTPAAAISNGDFAAITKLAREAVAIAKSVRGV